MVLVTNSPVRELTDPPWQTVVSTSCIARPQPNVAPSPAALPAVVVRPVPDGEDPTSLEPPSRSDGSATTGYAAPACSTFKVRVLPVRL